MPLDREQPCEPPKPAAAYLLFALHSLLLGAGLPDLSQREVAWPGCTAGELQAGQGPLQPSQPLSGLPGPIKPQSRQLLTYSASASVQACCTEMVIGATPVLLWAAFAPPLPSLVRAAEAARQLDPDSI